MGQVLTRRGFVALGGALLGSTLVDTAMAKTFKGHACDVVHVKPKLPAVPRTAERSVHIVNAHTNEALNAIYWRNGNYLPDAMHHVNRVLRDHMSGDVHVMDPRLVDLLNHLHRTIGASEPFQVISGYRSAKTNAWMHRTQAGVAANSLHVKGKAADIVLPGYDVGTLHNVALALGEGGVGFYPSSGFVHVDTGKVREWSFG